MLKRIAALFTAAAAVFCGNVSASVLGSYADGWYSTIAPQTNFYSNTFNDENVGAQKEFYVEYTPNSNIVPVIVNGESIYGKRNINSAVEYMKKNSLEPVAGINGDFFSFKTGIPMGHTIMGGEIVSKDGSGQNAVGFRSSGSGFISYLQIVSTMKSNGNEINIECINKWCQPGSVPFYLLTDYFGSETKTASDCIFVVFSKTGGELALGKTLELSVDDKFEYNGSVAIPDGKLVLCLDKASGDAACAAFVSSLAVGDKVQLNSEAVYDKELWNSASEGISSIGGRLVEKGVVNSNFAAGANPRTAIGVKADGSIVMYAIDGRQKGYSYGVQLKTLAKRMAELGCVDAINLDGGGSTVIGAVFDESAGFSVINKPSEGSLRSCANYIFLKKNVLTPTGIPGEITGSFRQNNNYLSGATEFFGTIGMIDTAGFSMNPGEITYAVSNTDAANGYIDDNNVVHLSGQGQTIVTISASGISKTIPLFSYNTPDDILVYENGNVSEITSYKFYEGDSFSVDLTADAYLNSAFLNCEDYNFEWNVEGDIGKITSDGVFTLNSDKPSEGAIVVSAGGYRHTVPVTVMEGSIRKFEDISGHWSEDSVNRLRSKNIINGINENGLLYFRPEQNVTRIQLAVMLCNVLGVNPEDYAENNMIFEDSDFDEWMKNYAKAAYECGFTKGRESGGKVYFDPKAYITRAEAMTMLFRISDMGTANTEKRFADDDKIPDWAKDAVYTLLANGIINGYGDNTINPGGEIKRSEAAAMLDRYTSNNYTVGE